MKFLMRSFLAESLYVLNEVESEKESKKEEEGPKKFQTSC